MINFKQLTINMLFMELEHPTFKTTKISPKKVHFVSVVQKMRSFLCPEKQRIPYPKRGLSIFTNYLPPTRAEEVLNSVHQKFHKTFLINVLAKSGNFKQLWFFSIF